MTDPLDALRWRDELLQVLFWLRGEGLGDRVAPGDLTTFLGAAEDEIRHRLECLVDEGYVDVVAGETERYHLTDWGAKEGGRRFADEFAGLTNQGHGECNNPNCSCQTLGPGACDSHAAHTH
ncbi:MAG: hypothetical protein AVDCRST_MAG70-2207 [uncultured Thermomicrobiales bacterium]|uniref:HTH hxlR-type domain-containing protein n=1 Tax=uncultured Thermomicrobiales bacterium TaxID=1645740 RepID=A0A6J4V7U0_9BACT|nr:MAG: hypothetical protein AVDCRST_MAG70-2207 [uncultured Thermomicrobiales bacterium]